MIVNILVWALFGLIAGALAQFIMPGKQSKGIVVTILLGIVGALVGGFVSSQLLGWDVTGFNLSILGDGDDIRTVQELLGQRFAQTNSTRAVPF